MEPVPEHTAPREEWLHTAFKVGLKDKGDYAATASRSRNIRSKKLLTALRSREFLIEPNLECSASEMKGDDLCEAAVHSLS